MLSMTPSQIVKELDRYIIGQADAKRSVAVALRNRYRRSKLAPEQRDEITPKNIIMSGPTGTVCEGGGDQVHRGRLCGPRCGFHGAGAC